jgi:PAS domain S-box-containing protein
MIQRLLNISFTAKFMLALLAASVVPLALGGYWLSTVKLDVIKTLSRDVYLSAARSVSNDLQRDATMLRDFVVKAGEVLNIPSFDENDAVSSIGAGLAMVKGTSALGIYTLNGDLIDILTLNNTRSSYPQVLPISIRKQLSVPSSPAVIVMERLTANAAPSLVVAARCEGARFTGITMAAIDNAHFVKLVTSAAESVFSGKRGTIYVTDDALRIVAHSNSAIMRTLLTQPENTAYRSLAGQGIFKNVQQGDTTIFTYNLGLSVEYEDTSDPTAESMLGTYSTIPALRLAIVVEQPQSVAYKSFLDMQHTLWVFGGIIVLMAALVGVGLARQFSRPITQLVEAAKKMAAQDFSERFTDDRRDEFGLLFSAYNGVAEQLEQYQRLNLNKILTERTKFEAMARQSSDGVLYVDTERTILLANTVFASWMNVEATALEGKNTDSVLNAAELLPLKQAIDYVLTSSEAVFMPVELRLQRVGHIRELVLRGSLVRVVADGVVAGAACALRDVSKEVEVDRMKTDLVRIAAHELRSPLVSIKGFGDLIAMGVIGAEDTQKYAETISAQADKLNHTITKFLDVSRIETGNTDIQRLPFKLRDVIESVLKFNEPLAREKNMTVETHFSETKPMVGDPELIGQVVLNLFSNAVKYSEPNKTIRITLREREADFYVSVEDQGYGLSEESQQKMFSKFFRATDDPRVKQQVGTGLGLAFIKEIVEQHGGTIGVESALYQGSTFWFTLPK